ncbi:MAG: SRPBCC family protein [Armatimonadetes bacterium]|nr:SRPBCC family protein [Armatimonadota bacterium]
MARAVAVEGRRLIKAPVQRVWQLLNRLESHPRYTMLWLAADLQERSATSAIVECRGFFGGLPIVSVQRFVLRPPTRMEFRQIRGELRDLTGAYLLKDDEGETELVCQIAVDAGIPLFSDAAVQQILAGHIEVTLARIKATAERDLVRVFPRRSRAAEAAGQPSEPAEDAEADEMAEAAAAGPAEAGAGAQSVPSATTDGAAPGEAGRDGTGPLAAGDARPREPRRRKRRRGSRRRRGNAQGQGTAPG